MKYYEHMVDLGCFTHNDIENLTGNRETAHSIIQSYKKKGLIEAVKRDLYIAVSLETKQPVPNRYVIATHAAHGAYVSYHSAFEYHGLANQVYYEIYTAAGSRFRTFEHGGLLYRYVISPFEKGIATKADGARVTDLERTVTDGIDDFEKCGGLEELLRCIDMIPYLNHTKLLEYLQYYHKTLLYKKAGYILEHYKNALKLPNCFFETCIGNITMNKQYLYPDLKKETHISSKKWALYVPGDLQALIMKGMRYE